MTERYVASTWFSADTVVDGGESLMVPSGPTVGAGPLAGCDPRS